jgi:DNA polymerase-4
VQDDLFAEQEDAEDEPLAMPSSTRTEGARRGPGWRPGMDVEHDDHGPGWVWGSGLGRVTVRFETADSAPGPVRTFAADDPRLRPRVRPAET